MGCELRRVPEIHRSFETTMRLCKTQLTSAMRNLICSSQLWRATSFLRLGVIQVPEAGRVSSKKLRNLSDRIVLVGFVASGPDDTCHHTHA